MDTKIPLDPLRCKGIKHTTYYGPKQCRNRHTTAAGYCKLHDPDILQSKRKARKEAWDAKWKEKSDQWDKEDRIRAAHEPMLAALKNLVTYCAGMNYDLGPVYEAIRIAENKKGA